MSGSPTRWVRSPTAVGKPFVIVGQSMGAPIAELVATARSERALGLVLLTPVPLAGTGCRTRSSRRFAPSARTPRRSAACVSNCRSRSRTPTWIASWRSVCGCGPKWSPAWWTAGTPACLTPRSAAGTPDLVLVVRGGDDGLVTEELVATAVSPRFASVQTVVIERAGHWPHLEQPAALAAQLDRFLTEHATSAGGNVAADARPQGWTNAFASKSAERVRGGVRGRRGARGQRPDPPDRGPRPGDAGDGNGECDLRITGVHP